MAGSTYSALSGMRSRLEELDRIASDLSNIGTAGYKTERASHASAARESFGSMLDSAVDVGPGVSKTDFSQGTLGTTGRDLDIALDGKGFFVIETPQGLRYTRNGSFTRAADGTLTTPDGHAVQGDGGPIKLGKGPVNIDEKGTLRAGNAVAGKLKIVTAPDEQFIRESGTRFALKTDSATETVDTRVVGGALEEANVSLVDRMAALTEISRGFEGLQKGVSTLYNELDSRAIAELGRR